MKKITFLMLIALITITTHGQNKLLSSIREGYYNGTWSKDYGTNYEYDSKNNLTAETNLSWDSGTETWKISSKTTYTYNASNKVTEEIEQDWNSTNNKLENDYKGIKTYTDGKLTEMLDYYWENASWVLDSKYQITYNSSNLPISYIYSELGDTQLELDERYTITYNANNKIASSTSEAWNGAQWVNSEKTLYTYNTQNKIISEKSADWDEFSSNWAANGNQTEYEWDATGNQTRETEYYKNSQGDISRYKNEYTYDTFNLMSSFAHPFKDKTGVDYFFEDFPYVNKVQVENGYSYNNQTNSFQLSSRTSYNYNSAITLSAPTIEKATTNISVYPNPARAFLNISNPSEIAIDKVFVTDLTGKKLLEQNNATQINVQNLAKGIYVLEAYSGKEKFQSKFIKE
jgi:Secretion system C-terminal sorting domain